MTYAPHAPQRRLERGWAPFAVLMQIYGILSRDADKICIKHLVWLHLATLSLATFRPKRLPRCLQWFSFLANHTSVPQQSRLMASESTGKLTYIHYTHIYLPGNTIPRAHTRTRTHLPICKSIVTGCCIDGCRYVVTGRSRNLTEAVYFLLFLPVNFTSV